MVRGFARAANGAEKIQRFGQSELLADEGLKESAASDFAAGLQTTKRHQQIAPRGSQRLTGRGIAEDDTPTAEQLASEDFGVVLGRVGGVPQQIPTARRVARASGASLPFPTAALGIEQGAEILEAIGGHEAGSYEFPEGIFDLTGEAAGGAAEVGEEGCAARFQSGEHLARRMGERLTRRRLRRSQ